MLFIGDQREDPEAIRQKIQHIEQEMGRLLVFAAQSEKMEMFEERFKAMTKEKTELAEKLEISKSCLNHRMRKIEELASKISAK